MKDEEYQVCRCIRTDCWHHKGQCEEPPSISGGVCGTCRYFPAAEKCPTCGQAVPK